MLKTLGKFLLFEGLFFIIGSFIFYQGLMTNPQVVTSDGFHQRNYYFLAGAFLAFIPLAVFIGVLIFATIKRRQMEDILTNGKQGLATILSLSDTGVRINNQPRIKLLLEILVPNYQPYRAEKTITLSMLYLPQVQTGSIINVMVDPEEPDNEKRIGLLLK